MPMKKKKYVNKYQTKDFLPGLFTYDLSII